MNILIADDCPDSRALLKRVLTRWGYEVVVTEDGEQAWEAMQRPRAPRMAILDWMMPGLDGVEVCHRARQTSGTSSTYLLLLTARSEREDLVTGLDAGADDYVVKPFDCGELRARVRAGERILALQEALSRQVTELEEALARVRQLEGILPICTYCKKIRDDGDYWQQVETYIARHSEARFSHGICPCCWDSVVQPQLARLKG